MTGRWYHGTTHEFRVGEVVLPAERPLHGSSTGAHVYVTCRDVAEEYALLAVDERWDQGDVGPLTPRVYEVEPLGPVEPDPAGMASEDGRTSGVRVVREVWRGDAVGG